MKKVLLILLASSLLLASCGGKDDKETNAPETDAPAVTETEAATESEPAIDEEPEELPDENAEGPAKVTAVASVDDAVAFIDANVYSQCMDKLPMSTMTNILPLEDADMISYHTGLTDVAGVTDILVSESMIGSFAYSFVMIRTDGSNTDDVHKALNENINPRKWICVSADIVRSVRLDNDIILVMGDADTAPAVMDAVIAAADGVYSNVGSVVNVLG